jgi:hypothetical protein
MKRLTLAALLLASCGDPSNLNSNAQSMELARLPKTQFKTCSDGSQKRYSQRCPAPSPTPSPTPTPTPAPSTPPPPNFPVVSPNGILGETNVPDNFDNSAWLQAGETPHVSPDEVGAFRFTCGAGQLAKDDPIVYPGLPGVSHLHQFFGNTGTNAFTTYQTLRTTGGSTCTNGSSGTWPGLPGPSTTESPQRSAYWMPAMLDGAGNAVKPDWMKSYYKQRPASDPLCANTSDPSNIYVAGPSIGQCIGMPNGIRFILGYNMKTGTGGPLSTNQNADSDYWRITFDCNSSDPTANEQSYLPAPMHSIKEVVDSGRCPIGAWFRTAVVFPPCWDGHNLDVADHQPRILVIDIETKLIDVRTFGIRDQYLDIKQIRDIKKSARGIHCIGMKWAGERKVTVLSEWEHGYREMIVGARDALDQADAVVGFNHENFDMKKMRGQFALLGIDYPKPPTNIDIFKTVRQMGFPSSKLDYIAQAFGIGRKVKHPGFEMWNDALNGCPKGAEEDGALLRRRRAAYRGRLSPAAPYIETHPYLGKASGYSCNRCGSKNLTSQGEKRTRHWRIQSLKCGDCGGWRQGLRKKIAVRCYGMRPRRVGAGHSGCRFRIAFVSLLVANHPRRPLLFLPALRGAGANGHS